jgi:sterol desaturase/sphingolipid hydroxylase (fatty acid hydroxylase superfamily)
MSREKAIEMVDHAALRSNQAMIMATLLVAFVTDSALLVGLVAALMIVGTALGTQGFRWVYAGVLRPLRVVRPDPVPDHTAPHRFAQGLGGVFLLAAGLALALSASIVGWALAWLVILLAALNLFLGFCAGCFVYYWLSRWRIPGFTHAPPAGTFPGLRPQSRRGMKDG